MTHPGIHAARVQTLREGLPRSGRYVLYWMQASCRAECNHALEYAVLRANELRQPVLACFGLTPAFPEGNARHYTFLLEGLQDARRALARRGIPLVVRVGAPDEVASDLAREASLVVTDRGYLRIQREWRARAARSIAAPLVQVESDVVVPVESASHREEYSAATLRPKIHALLPGFLVPLPAAPMRAAPLAEPPGALDLADVAAVVAALGVDGGVAPVAGVIGGSSRALRLLDAFVAEKLPRYHLDRNDPGLAGQSGLGPYLHFGHISPLQIALAVRAAPGRAAHAGAAAFLEELIVRRELSANFVHYHPRYDRFECLPDWCRATLDAHADDRRPYVYTEAQLEAACTHDPYWNAAQAEMVRTGSMHGYMRMYWGKKILEWTPGPKDAFGIALCLNNRYQLDGRDPNSFAGVAWCFGKHDRPWGERPVFGMVRYMNAAGLSRKFDIEAYVRRVRDPGTVTGARRSPGSPAGRRGARPPARASDRGRGRRPEARGSRAGSRGNRGARR